MRRLSRELREAIERVRSKRPRTVLEHLLERGFITTEELREQYGYDHPPRAARDVREEGIALETFRVRASNGRMIAAYRLAVGAPLEGHLTGGRQAIPKRVKLALLEARSHRCETCGTEHTATFLQVDHRVPFGVSGEATDDRRADEVFMLLCRSCNRAKSWTCEHCPNWTRRRRSTCARCYWANPEDYRHVAMGQERRVDLVVQGEDVRWFDRLVTELSKRGVTLREYLLGKLRGG